MKELFNALSIVQTMAPTIVKDTKNPFYNRKYATLPTVLNVLLPLLKENGLLLHNTIADNVLTAHITHCDTAQEITTQLPLLNTSDMQKLGACITYAQRYALLSLVGLAPEEDDDGNFTTTPAKTPAKTPATTPATTPLLIEKINSLIKTCNDTKIIERVKAYDDLNNVDEKILHAMIKKLTETQGE